MIATEDTEVVMADTEEDTVDTAGMVDMADTEDVGRATDVTIAVRAGAAANTGDKPPKEK